MCGRYAITSAEALRQWFQTYGSLPNWPANYNAAPTNILPVVRQTKEGREIALMERELIPHFSKEATLQLLGQANWPGLSLRC